MKSPKSPLLPLLPTNYSSLSVLQRTIIFMSIKTNKHGISSCSKANRYGEQKTTSQQKSRRKPLLPQLRIPQEDQIIQLSQICRVLCSLVQNPWLLVQSLWDSMNQITFSMRIFVVSWASLCNMILFPLFCRLPRLWLLFGCEYACFYQFLDEALLMTVVLDTNLVTKYDPFRLCICYC